MRQSDKPGGIISMAQLMCCGGMVERIRSILRKQRSLRRGQLALPLGFKLNQKGQVRPAAAAA